MVAMVSLGALTIQGGTTPLSSAQIKRYRIAICKAFFCHLRYKSDIVICDAHSSFNIQVFLKNMHVPCAHRRFGVTTGLYITVTYHMRISKSITGFAVIFATQILPLAKSNPFLINNYANQPLQSILSTD